MSTRLMASSSATTANRFSVIGGSQDRSSATSIAWWSRHLEDLEPMPLPLERTRGPADDGRRGQARWRTDWKSSNALGQLARHHGATPWMALLGIFDILLARHCRHDDIAVAATVDAPGAPRDDGSTFRAAQPLVLRTSLAGDPDFADLLGRIDRTVREAAEHPVPYEEVIAALAPAPEPEAAPLVAVSFTVHPSGSPSPGRAADAPRFDLELQLAFEDDGVRMTLDYAAGLFDAARIEAMAQHFQRLLQAVLEKPDTPVSTLPMLSAVEKRGLVSPPLDGCPDEEASTIALFEAQCRRTPRLAAVTEGEVTIDYATLDARANRLAHHLRRLGVGRDDRVAVCLERSIDTIVALVAIGKAGGAYVPIDPQHPAARTSLIVEDACPRVLLARTGTATGLDVPPGTRVLLLDEAAGAIAAEAATPPGSPAGPRDLAYVLYTSGSTGRPKGVMVEQRNLANHARWFAAEFELDPRDVALQRTTLSFDAAGVEIWPQLVSGGSILIADDATTRDPRAMLELVRRGQVTLLQAVPGQLAAMVDELVRDPAPLPLRGIFVGGEALPASDAQRWHELTGIALHNMYGPTETTIDAAWHRFDPQSGQATVPIGRPPANCFVRLLDDALRPVPPGARGEICIGGAGVARGYLNRPELNAGLFIADPTGATGRLYRSGDEGRLRSDGTLEYLGRADQQVKIRGHRIELGEIEAALGALGARQATVIAVRDAVGTLRLAAYVAPSTLSPDALAAGLRAALPDYMCPATIQVLERLPTLPNGKLDRKALPAPLLAPHSRKGRGPQDEIEATIIRVWDSLLGAGPIELDDDFFALGGDSLTAARAVARLGIELAIDIRLSALFEAPTVATLAAKLRDAPRSAPVGPTPLPARDPTAAGCAASGMAAGNPPASNGDPLPQGTVELPATAAQQALWYVESLAGTGAGYHIAELHRIGGAIDPELLARALERLMARHDVLRSRIGSHGGNPGLLVEASVPLPFSVAAVAGDPLAQAGRIAEAPFELATGPLWRAALLREDDRNAWLVLVVHHIISDGWSMDILWSELGAIHDALQRGAEPVLALPAPDYGAYARWQVTRETGPGRHPALGHWRERLQGLESLDLPLDRARPKERTFAGARHRFTVDAGVRERLSALARAHGATLYMVLLAAWHATLSRHSGQTDFAIGTPVAGRNRPEFESLVGYLVNMLVLRTDSSDDPAFGDLVDRVRTEVIDALDHQDLAFATLVSELAPERDAATNPLFQVSFALQNTPRTPLALAGMDCEPVPLGSRTAKFDLALSIVEHDGRLEADLDYASELFDAARIERLARHYGRILEQASLGPTTRISDFMPCDAAEDALLARWSQGLAAPYPADASLAALFEAQVQRTPHAIALDGPGGTMSYAELDQAASRMATILRDSGVTPGALVALAAGRDQPMLVALLGIVKAGAAYLPLDPSYPAERLQLMIEDASPVLLVHDESVAGLLATLPGIPALSLRADQERIARAAPLRGSSGASGASLAYVMYTSGSTGRPKGTLISQRSIARLVCGTDYVKLGPDDAISQVSNVSFDAATFEIWGAWLNGARLVSLPADTVLSAERLRTAIETHGVTTMFLTTALFNAHAASDPGMFGALRYLLFGGEAADRASIRRILDSGTPPAGLLNVYGPTETTTFATAWPVPASAAALDRAAVLGVPIGRPIANTSCHVLDARGRPQPIGVIGELHIGGPGVALGYLGQERLTQERFVPDRFGPDADSRLYRTGDLVRWRDDGTLLYVGRNDQQVKIRGFRIELGEIEAALHRCQGVREAAVLVDDDPSLGKRLVAFVVAERGDGDHDSQGLRGALRGELPEYMVPALIHPVDVLPVTRNGKLDRAALLAMLPQAGSPPATGRGRSASTESRRGIDATTRRLLDLWRRILRQPDLGPDDHFFEAGGHSLLALRMLGEVEREFGCVLRVATLFDAPSARRFAALLRKAHGESPAGASCAVTITAGDDRPPLFFVSGYGSEIVMFRDLARELGPGQPLVILDTAAFPAGKLAGQGLPDVARWMLEDMRRLQPHGPYHLAGFSLGGEFAYEMARQLRADGEAVELVALLDCPAPGYPPRRSTAGRIAFHVRELGRRTFGQKLAYLREQLMWLQRRRTRGNLFEHAPELAGLTVARAMKESANAILEIWEHNEPGRYAGPLLVIRAGHRDVRAAVVDDDPRLGWQNLTDGPVATAELDCVHNDMLARRQAPALAAIFLEHLRHEMPPVAQPAAEPHDTEPTEARPAQTA